jgi:hypothetical protein
MICPELSQMPSPEPDSPQVDDLPLEFMIEPPAFEWAFPGLAGACDCTAIMPDGEDGELEDQSVMEVLTSDCIVLSPRKLARNTLLVAIAVDWASTIGVLDPDCISHKIRSEFRCKWWFWVKDNEIGFSALPIWN